MKAHVDPDLCTGCQLCVELCPDVFQMNDDGVAVAITDEIPSDLEAGAREAAESCPVEAISIK